MAGLPSAVRSGLRSLVVVAQERDQVADRGEAERPARSALPPRRPARRGSPAGSRPRAAAGPGRASRRRPARPSGSACRSSDHWPRGIGTRSSVSRIRQVRTPSASPFGGRRVAAVPLAARQRQRLGRRVGDHLVADDAADRLAVLGRDRRPAAAGGRRRAAARRSSRTRRPCSRGGTGSRRRRRPPWSGRCRRRRC